MRHFTHLTLLLITFVALAGCGDGPDTTSTSTSQPPAAVTATTSATVSLSPTSPPETPTADTRRTGITSIDVAIDAVLARDAAAVRTLIDFTPIGCIVEPQGIGAPPFCRPGEAEGTLVDVLPSAQCEGFYSRPDEINLNDTFNTSVMGLYGVYRVPPDFFPPGIYAIVFVQNRPGLDEGARELVMTDRGIVGINYSCGESPMQMVLLQKLTDAIVPPP